MAIAWLRVVWGMPIVGNGMWAVPESFNYTFIKITMKTKKNRYRQPRYEPYDWGFNKLLGYFMAAMLVLSLLVRLGMWIYNIFK